MKDSEIEQVIKEKGLNAPRITKERIDALCASLTVQTHHFAGTTLTIARAFLPDGFAVGRGESACVSTTNFNAELGAQIASDNALEDARKNLWELEGYALRERLAMVHVVEGDELARIQAGVDPA